ncbi:MAG: bifunctional glycosyltransferase family 2/GtrA family protein [Eubacteriales bacterium]|nr:bifunctional glycosyltransferase family 2/GtrA family protein [Eubacteriales bacterium]
MTNPSTDISVCAVLPSLNPTEKLCQVIDGLLNVGFREIVIVDDGSDAEHQAPFDYACSLPQCHVLRHPVNRGKGAALKTAFQYILDERPNVQGVVTADGDGQHLPEDILNCSRVMVEKNCVILGARDFTLPDIPPKSRMGNRITSFIFRTGCGIHLCDTQTGLRVFPKHLLRFLLDVRGERFEYETNMLLEMKRADVAFEEVPIATVYEDGNSGTHFRPVRDALRIYSLILKYMASSLASFLLDIGAFYVLMRLLGSALGNMAILTATVGARIISSFFNFNMNKKLVFSARGNYRRALLRYYILCVIQMLISAGLVSLMSALLGNPESGAVTLVKTVVDTLLFFCSFHIQREWVFRDKNKSARDA